MKSNLFVLIITMLVFTFIQVSSPATTAGDQVEAVKKVMPAVVGIGVIKRNLVSYRFSGSDFFEEFKRYYQEEEQKFRRKAKPQWDTEKEKLTVEDIQVIGSGFIFDKNGKIFTNYHVVEGQRQIFVRTYDGRIYKGQVVKVLSSDDIAMVEIDGKGEIFPTIELGDSDVLEIAQPILAIGNPSGLVFTVTSGIISAMNRSIGESEDIIQIDAAINPGNSGGPLINLNGEVVGITSMLHNPAGQSAFAGIGFAIPISRAKVLLTSTPEPISKAYFGIHLNTVEGMGVFIDHVDKGSPADVAGLKKGDIIISLDEKEFTSANKIVKYIKGKKPGDKILIKVKRVGRIHRVEVILGSMKPG